MDGGEDLNDHIETLQINVRDGENVETFEITVPNAVGFLLLKPPWAIIGKSPRTPMTFYYYCRYSEISATTRPK